MQKFTFYCYSSNISSDVYFYESRTKDLPTALQVGDFVSVTFIYDPKNVDEHTAEVDSMTIISKFNELTHDKVPFKLVLNHVVAHDLTSRKSCCVIPCELQIKNHMLEKCLSVASNLPKSKRADLIHCYDGNKSYNFGNSFRQTVGCAQFKGFIGVSQNDISMKSTIAIHEIGHNLGCDHPKPPNKKAIMSSGCRTCQFQKKCLNAMKNEYKRAQNEFDDPSKFIKENILINDNILINVIRMRGYSNS